ncbi:hypothetical protein [Nocardia brasiliensis]|uniref:hypothetical protein n=1 Tax=Nocardia brasiliensis TaxID=37326 RepID=UPI002455B5AD|nr:hypothetical protein [Nocardia brasiliensis]
MSRIHIPARDLPDHIGAKVVGHGKLAKAAVIQPGGDIVVTEFGEGFGRREKVFRPDELVTIETNT